MKSKTINEVNTNIFLLLPAISSLYFWDAIYFFLSISILFASSIYHYNKSKSLKYIKELRLADIIIASASYLYMFYYVSIYNNHALLQYSFLILTLAIFFIGKIKNNNSTIHSYFHISIGLVAGLIPVIANL